MRTKRKLPDRKDLINLLITEHNLTKEQATKALDVFLRCILEARESDRSMVLLDIARGESFDVPTDIDSLLYDRYRAKKMADILLSDPRVRNMLYPNAFAKSWDSLGGRPKGETRSPRNVFRKELIEVLAGALRNTE